jgi:3-polyprenyl-4-hydroxybenzoate decarboxylase
MTIQSSEQLPLVLAITGASGAVYAVRLLQLLWRFGGPLSLIIIILATSQLWSHRTNTVLFGLEQNLYRRISSNLLGL